MAVRPSRCRVPSLAQLDLLNATRRWFEDDLGSEVIFWCVAHVHVHSLLPIPLRRHRAILVDYFDVLDLLRNMMFSKAYKNKSYLSLKKLGVTVVKLHLPAPNAELTVLARIKQFIQVSSLDLLFPVINVNDYGMASTVPCTRRCGQGLCLRGSGAQSVTRQLVQSVTKQKLHPRLSIMVFVTSSIVHSRHVIR